MLGTATLEGITSRLDNPDEWISELEDRVVEITQGEKKNEFFKSEGRASLVAQW